MKITRANVKDYADRKGLEPLVDDGIDGFAWVEPDIEINCKKYKGRKIKFKPLANWEDEDSITYE